MRLLIFALMIALATPAGSRAAPPPADGARAELRAAEIAALQADLKSALPHLRRLRVEQLAGERAVVGACMRERFVDRKAAPPAADLDPWAGRVLALYRRYWTQAMLEPETAVAAEHELARRLGAAVSADAGATQMDALEALLKSRLEALGLHALFGVTAPLREFMLWRTQSERSYEIELPQGRETVHVVFLDGFASLGWLGYATCDDRHSGGWATHEALYAVRSAYDLDAESFRVSYLAHEGQHFSDYRRFPELAQPDLEYRAKLVELALAQSTLYSLLREFSDDGADDRTRPHPWADRQVVTRLAERLLGGVTPTAAGWNAVPVEQLHAAARELLDQDSRQRTPGRAADASPPAVATGSPPPH